MGITDDLGACLKRSYRIAIALAVLGLLIGLVAAVFGASAGCDFAPRDLRAVALLVPMPQTLLEYARLLRRLEMGWCAILSFCNEKWR